MRHIFIGDVHGLLPELKELVAKLSLRSGDRLIFVGDLVDKGPDSLGVLRYVRGMGEAALVIAGNHEEKASRFAKRGEWVEPWAEHATAEDWAFIDAMPLTVYFPEVNVRVVHGGIFPALLRKHPDAFERIEARGAKWRKGGGKVMNRARRMLRVRYVGGDHREGGPYPGDMLALGANGEGDHFWADVYDGSQGTVIFGHSPWLDGIVRHYPHAIGIDTAAVFGAKLTAFVVHQHGLAGAETVSVDAHKQYAEPMKGVD